MGKIGALRVGHLSPARGTLVPRRLRLHGKKVGDGNGVREVPIPDELLTLLLESLMRRGRPGTEAHLLGVKGGILRPRGRDKLVAAYRALGIEPFTWHGVRRCVVKRMRNTSVSVRVAAGYLGHHPTVMLNIYDSVNDDELEAEMARAWGSGH